MRIHIAIPTFQRPQLLKETTLKLLSAFDESKITIYVEDLFQKELYQNVIGLAYNIVITSTRGIGEKRNWIKTHCRARHLFMIDDDIREIKEWSGACLQPDQVKTLIKQGFKKCKEAGLRLWGINGFDNCFYMKNTETTNLKFICGNFHGTILTQPIIKTPIDLMEDYYNTLEHFKQDGGVLRLNGYGTKTKFFKEEGGIQGRFSPEERIEKEIESAKVICDMFGDKMVKTIVKKNGRVDLRLNNYYKCPIPTPE